MRRSLALLAVPLLLAALPAQAEEQKALAEFKRAFKTKKPASVQKRIKALGLLAELDSLNVCKALAKAAEDTFQEVATVDATRMDMTRKIEELRDLAKIDKKTGQTRFPSTDVYNQWKTLSEKVGDMRHEIDELRGLMFQLSDRVQTLRDKEGLKWMLQNVVGKKKISLQTKLAAARAAGSAGEEMIEPLTKAINRARRSETIIALLDGLGLMAAKAQPAAKAVIKLLQHKDETIRERAALALSRICVPEAIAPMIELLARSYGQSKKRIGACLEILCRKEFGDNAATWRNWWAEKSADYLAGKEKLGGGIPSHREAFNKKNYYFNIPQDGKSIVYIIDSSGSMKKEVSIALLRKIRERGEGTASPDRPDGKKKKTKTTRLEACKAELIRALGRLAPDVKFNVLWFSSEPHLHLKQMTKASPDAIKTAQAWVRKLKPNNSTNIHDTLQMAFTLTGRGVKDKHYGLDFDTIFLLTDGSPTLPPGNKLDSTEKIIKAVRTWNPLKRVIIHCIGIGNGVNRPFMEQLAKENGGQFEHVID